MIYLTRDDVVSKCSRALGMSLVVRDEGLLQAAVGRPRASVFGEDAYPSAWDKAAALAHSIVTSHPFVDGNKRAGWTAAWLFLAVNGHPIPDVIDDDESERLVLGVASGLFDWQKLSERLRGI